MTSPAREDRGALDHVLDLPDVARPAVGLELRDGLGRERGRGARVAVRVLPQEVLGERADVAFALAERRQANREDGDARGQEGSGNVSASGHATSRLGVSETTTRTSTAVGSVAPTRSTTPSLRTRTRRACRLGRKGDRIFEVDRPAVGEAQAAGAIVEGAVEGAALPARRARARSASPRARSSAARGRRRRR